MAEDEAFKKFEVVRLDTEHRQTNPDFDTIQALNHLRVGDGGAAVPHLKAAGVTFVEKAAYGFEGATITGTKETMDKINNVE